MSCETSEETNSTFKCYLAELEHLSLSSKEAFTENAIKFLELNQQFTIQQNLAILKLLESKCSVKALIIRKANTSTNDKFKFIKFVLKIFYIISSTEFGKLFRKNFKKLESTLNALMLYTLIKSSEQFNLFKLKYDEDYVIENNEMFRDEISLIELMNEFRNSVLYLARKFKILHTKYMFSEQSNNFLIYEYMTCLMTIWADTTFEIKHKINMLDSSQFVNSLRINSNECKILIRLENLFSDQSVSITIVKKINIFLDSIVYYMCDFILLLENLNFSTIESLVPLLKKIVEIQSKRLKVSKSLYLRLILVHAKFNSLKQTDDFGIDFFEQLIKKMKLSNKFKAFCLNIIKKHQEQEFVSVFQTNLKMMTNQDCPSFLSNNLNTSQIAKMYEALRNRSFRKSWLILRLINQEFGKKIQSSIQIRENVEFICDKPKPTSFQIEIEPNENCDKNEFENLLDFTSDLSLFGYSSDENVDQQNNSKLKIEMRKNDFDNSLIDRNCLNLNRKDLTNEKNIAFSTSSPIDEFDSKKCCRISHEFDLNLKCKERSPSPSNISKLNLFKNIFDDKLQSYIFNKNSNKIETELNEAKECKKYKLKSTYHQSNKFYKLNDLVSVMINEDYFQT